MEILISVKEVLLDQLAACHDDESWIKPSITILNDVPVKRQSGKQKASWNETIRRLSNGFVRWQEVIMNCDDSKLEKRIPSYFNAQWWGVISNLCIHNAYHIGQMMLLKKQVQKYRA
ncbi:hypothetical protein [Paenibacillus alginolyticus]|uniref:DinB family protein n=1 Tax=Paenibacillus alginolyticus TaxID=59839 RepID=A0ABT4G5V5_9BACL|nr:hypothetical protein [Paenibacillus alginolyticus]MCY9691549.1 hypothetical protein [Paenibacillus alginolyticus]MEC0147015.1 hypothetical protein [Paenibacillus alginolyticus]